MTNVQLHANKETLEYYGILAVAEYEVTFLQTGYRYFVVKVSESMFNRLTDAGIMMSRKGEAFSRNVGYDECAKVVNLGRKVNR